MCGAHPDRARVARLARRRSLHAQRGYSDDVAAHGIIAVTTIALERGLHRCQATTRPASSSTRSPGLFARARMSRRGTASARACPFVNVPSFVLHGGLSVQARARGASVPTSRSAGRSTPSSTARRRPADRRGAPAGASAPAWRSRARSKRRMTIAHPLEPAWPASTGRSSPGRRTTSARRCETSRYSPMDASTDRRAGPGTSAVMAVLDAMGLLGPDSAVRPREPDRHALHRPRRRPDDASATTPAIVPEIEGSAWITGEHTFRDRRGRSAEGRVSV